MTERILWVLATVLLFVGVSIGQSNEGTWVKSAMTISEVNSEIKIDGILNEDYWLKALIFSDFKMQQPTDEEPASRKTEVQIGFDDKNIYIAARCFDDSLHVVRSLKRDNFGDDDSSGVLFDPVNQKTNGFAFGVNVLGAQTETLIYEGDADNSWDNKWFVSTQQYDNYWTAEMAIPFKSLRYESNKPEWGIQFVRVDPGNNETHVWSPAPRQFDFYDLGYYGKLVWDKAPDKTGNNISIIPYTAASISKNFNPETDTDFNLEVGGDLKFAITPSLNLDLTYNPDFSQVEVDDQVTNLTRFNIFFPERRQFFIENGDIFNGFGQFADAPFYSRRIGLDEGGRRVPIIYGARLTGNVSEKFRLGVLNMHTESSDERNGQNYSSLVFQHRLWKRSSFKGIFLNRQAYDGSEQINSDYGRNLGGQFEYSTPDGKWRGHAGYIHSFKDGFDSKNKHLYGRFDYDGQEFRTFLAVQNIGENYFADMGFNGRLINFNPETGDLVRIGYTQVSSMQNFYIYPEKESKINFHWSGIENFVYVNEGGELNEWYLRLRHFFFYQNTSQLRFRLNYNYVNLVYPFAITTPFIPAEEYHMTEFNVQFNTDVRKKWSTEMFIVYGGFYGGSKLTYRGSFELRLQPWGNFSVGLERNDIWFPEPYQDVHLNLATLKAEINFTTNLFWTTYIQYNDQSDNFNINSRFQWRFAPMSDLFLVYNDNYLVEGMLGPKDRSIILKLNYWLGL